MKIKIGTATFFFSGFITETFLIKKKKVAVPIFILLISFILSACGYHIAGRGGHIQPVIESIAIPVFKNETMEPIIEEEITSAILKEFLKDGRIRVVEKTQADLVLQGSVTSYMESPLSFDRDQNALEYRLTVTVHLRLLQQSANTVLWERDIDTSAEYRVSSDIMSNRASKLLTLKEISQNISEEVTDRVLGGW